MPDITTEDLFSFVDLIERTMKDVGEVEKDKLAFEFASMIVLLDLRHPEVLDSLQNAIIKLNALRAMKNASAF